MSSLVSKGFPVEESIGPVPLVVCTLFIGKIGSVPLIRAIPRVDEN